MLTSKKTTEAQDCRDGYAVMLLHAFPLSSEMWVQQLDALEKEKTAAIAPNSYGIEGSEEHASWNFGEYAEELAGMLDGIGCRKATIVGLSMGGYQALAFYRLFPERTASLVLCDTRAEADAPDAARQRQEFIDAVKRGGPEEAVKRMIPNYFTPETHNDNPQLVERAKTMIATQPVTAITSAMKAIMSREDSSSLLPEISCPVLVLNGLEDRLTTPETAAGITARIPGADIELIENAAHLSNMEQPDRFNRLLLDHIRQVTGN